MSTGAYIANRLLESEDDDDLSPLEIVRHSAQAINAEDLENKNRVQRDFNAGKVTPETVMLASGFYHRTQKYKARRGKVVTEPIYARTNGAVKTWKTRPGEFRVPMKYGMYDCFYIDHTNAHEWSTVPNPTDV